MSILTRNQDLEQRFKQRSQELGLRITPQRLAVYRALASDPSHPTAEALYEKLKPELPSLSLTSIYRILETLVRQGFARKISSSDGLGHFDANLEKHQHLVCRNCGRLEDCFVPSLAGLKLPAGSVGSFCIEEIEVQIVGLCPQCHQQSTQAAPC